ncbi:hypothetical protein BC829DRAFT_399237 [Chytridium lagenaria]|nr:hypothetical protein BC829DRAFT_399237 [Chytridium lagenaria]
MGGYDGAAAAWGAAAAQAGGMELAGGAHHPFGQPTLMAVHSPHRNFSMMLPSSPTGGYNQQQHPFYPQQHLQQLHQNHHIQHSQHPHSVVPSRMPWPSSETSSFPQQPPERPSKDLHIRTKSDMVSGRSLSTAPPFSHHDDATGRPAASHVSHLTEGGDDSSGVAPPYETRLSDTAALRMAHASDVSGPSLAWSGERGKERSFTSPIQLTHQSWQAFPPPAEHRLQQQHPSQRSSNSSAVEPSRRPSSPLQPHPFFTNPANHITPIGPPQGMAYPQQPHQQQLHHVGAERMVFTNVDGSHLGQHHPLSHASRRIPSTSLPHSEGRWIASSIRYCGRARCSKNDETYGCVTRKAGLSCWSGGRWMGRVFRSRYSACAKSKYVAPYSRKCRDADASWYAGCGRWKNYSILKAVVW